MNNFLKKSLVSMLAVTMMLSVAACGAKAKEEAKPENGETKVEETQQVAEFTGKYVVDAEYVKNSIGKENVLIVDARGEDAAKKGTVEGAIATTWQYLATCEDGKAGDSMWGTILDAERLSERLGGLGISKDKEIILFAGGKDGWGDDGRILWELLCAGYENVKMVNGSFETLKTAEVPTVKGATAPTPAEVKIDKFDMSRVINTDDLKATYEEFKVVDVRADEEFEGKALYGETKGGHLPGAVHIKFTDLYREDGTLKSNDEIIKMFEDKGITKTDKIVTYCTAGIRSGYMQLILEMCGFEKAANYDESYYRWCAVNEVE